MKEIDDMNEIDLKEVKSQIERKLFYIEKEKRIHELKRQMDLEFFKNI